MHNEAICKGQENPKFYYDIEKHKFGADPLGPKTKGIAFSRIKIGRETRRQSKDKREYQHYIHALDRTLP